MALKSGLSLYCYTLPSSTPPLVREYAEELVGLSFTTLAPGGFGDMSAVLHLADARQPRLELALFSRAAIMAGTTCLWVGELTDPELAMTDQDGEYVQLTGLGIGNALRDDPISIAYSAQTPKAIVTDQLSRRSAFLPIDQDTTQIFPDNPTVTFAPVYDGRNMEDVIADICAQAGDYQYGVWAHPHDTDAAGFPLGQVVVHLRDVTTTAYQASISSGEVIEYHVTPSAERAYNVIEIGYAAGPAQGYNVARWTDPRLNADGSQGTAPFRRRKYLRDLSSISTVTAAQAAAIAQTFGQEYCNPTNKVDITLVGIRDAYGNALPLWLPAADRNLYLPELAVRGTQLPTGPAAGINQFYLVQTTYTEDAQGGQTLEVQGDNFVDSAELQIARLQLQADVQQRGGKVTAVMQTVGAAESGRCGVQWSTCNLANAIGGSCNFKATMAQRPTSISFTPDSTIFNTSNPPTLGKVDATGFNFSVTCNGSGGALNGWWTGNYQTVGN